MRLKTHTHKEADGFNIIHSERPEKLKKNNNNNPVLRLIHTKMTMSSTRAEAWLEQESRMTSCGVVSISRERFT